MAKNEIELPKGITQDDLDKALKLLERNANAQAKAKEKRANMTEEEKAVQTVKAKRNAARRRIMLRKAEEAGITVTEAEIENEIG